MEKKIITPYDFTRVSEVALDHALVRSEKGENIETIVRIGNIFEDIDKVSSEMEADLIIMGTHGIRGMQFLTGSRALKIVTESLVPFIVTQERTIRPHGYHKLVVPMDLQKETKQKLTSVGDRAKYFNSKVYLVSPNETDEGVWIYQNAWFHLGRFDKGVQTLYTLKQEGNGVYAFVLKGKFNLDGIEVENRDGLGIWETEQFNLTSSEDGAEILLMEVPM